MKKSLGRIFSLAIGCMVLGACATYTSRADAPSQVAGANDGLTYFLPRQLATVTAKRTPQKLAKAVKAVSDAQQAVTEGEAVVTQATAAVQAARTALANAKDDNARRVLTDALTDAQASLIAANQQLTRDRGKLDTATTTLRGEALAARTAGPGAYDVTLSISLEKPTADPRFAYRLNPQHSAFRDDEHKLTISSSGLLATSNVVAADRTADILTEIATFAGAITGPPLSSGLPRDGRDPRTAKDCSHSPDEFSGVVDLANPFDVAKLNDDLQCLGVRLVVEGKYWAQSTQPVANPQGEIEGIVYRTPVELLVRVEKCTDTAGNCTPTAGWFPTQVLAYNLPQAGPISVARQDAGFMTRTEYTLAFDNGMLTSYNGNRPSELLEVARTPMRLVNGVFDGVSKIISLRTGQANSLTQLSAAQLNLANALSAQQVGAINNQQQLSAAQVQLVNALTAERLADLNNQRQLSVAEQQLLGQIISAQYASQVANLNGQQSVSTANLALLQAQQQLGAQGVTGQTALSANQLALLNAQTNLAVAQDNVPSQLAAAQYAAMLAAMRDQAQRAALDRCVSQQVAAGQPIDICLQ